MTTPTVPFTFFLSGHPEAHRMISLQKYLVQCGISMLSKYEISMHKDALVERDVYPFIAMIGKILSRHSTIVRRVTVGILIIWAISLFAFMSNVIVWLMPIEDLGIGFLSFCIALGTLAYLLSFYWASEYSVFVSWHETPWESVMGSDYLLMNYSAPMEVFHLVERLQKISPYLELRIQYARKDPFLQVRHPQQRYLPFEKRQICTVAHWD